MIILTEKGKTMDDYIKREDAVRRIAVLIAAEAESDGYEDQPMENYIEYASEDLTDIPSADVAPVRHGRWIDEEPTVIKCSACGEEFNDEIVYMTCPYNNLRYCPGCGAKMDLED